MGDKKVFWYANMASIIVIWAFIIYGAFFSDLNGAPGIVWLVFTLMFCILHPLELLVSSPIARTSGVPAFKNVIMTLVFGIVWWLPLKRGIFEG